MSPNSPQSCFPRVWAISTLFLNIAFLTRLEGADTPSSAWEYKSEKYSFSVMLPDSEWIERPSSIGGVVGFTKKGFAMRFDIFIVPCHTEAAYREYAARVMKEMEAAKNISEVAHESGETIGGSIFQYGTGSEKVAKVPTGVYLGQSLVWLKDRNILARVCFQGQTEAMSATILGVDIQALRSTARSLCLSVR